MITLIRNLLKGPSSAPAKPPEHALIVQFTYGSTDLSALFALEAELASAIQANGAGEYDGNEIAADGSDGTLYMYGPNADALYEAVRATLQSKAFMDGARARIRYGQPGAQVREEIIRRT